MASKPPPPPPPPRPSFRPEDRDELLNTILWQVHNVANFVRMLRDRVIELETAPDPLPPADTLRAMFCNVRRRADDVRDLLGELLDDLDDISTQ